MEFTKTEVAAIEQVEIKDVVKELENLELSLIGGGMGDIVLA